MKNIKVRIQDYTSNGYKMKSFQFIRHPYKDSLMIEVLGLFIFQEYNGKFYNPRFELSSDRYTAVIEFAKIVKLFKGKCDYDDEWETVLEKMGADVYELIHNEFINVKDKGKRIYSLWVSSIEIYCHFIASNDKQAKKISERYRGVTVDRLTYVDIC